MKRTSVKRSMLGDLSKQGKDSIWKESVSELTRFFNRVPEPEKAKDSALKSNK